MKNSLPALLLLLLFAALCACGFVGDSDPPDDPPAVLLHTLVVEHKGDTLLLTARDPQTGETSSLYTLHDNLPAYDADGAPLDPSALVPGVYLDVLYSGTSAETYPAQPVGAVSLTRTGSRRDLVTAYVRLADNHMPANVPWVALDLSGAVGLTAGEAEAVCYILQNLYADACTILPLRRETMRGEGLLDSSGKPVGGAILSLWGDEPTDRILHGQWRLTGETQNRSGETQMTLASE